MRHSDATTRRITLKVKRMVEVKIKLLPGGKMPTRATAGSAGWDLYAICDRIANDYACGVYWSWFLRESILETLGIDILE